MIHRQIDVALGERSYPIYIGNSMNASFAPTCQQHGIPKRVVIMTDTNVAHHYLKPLERHLRHFQFDVSSIVIPPGERQKSLQRASAIFTELLKRNVGRKSAFVALGGGVIGDLVGFVAATYSRGVALIQAPTTLLSQVDSSVGGKVAVNHPLGKNIIGAFYQPKFVWTDSACLRTLPPREIACGIGEIVKYSVILDAELFAYIEANLDRILKLDQEAVMHVQGRCCEMKAHITSEDERETGIRTILNYGHTVGHALEAAGNFTAIKHGEAVLLGMVTESYLAREMGMVNAEIHERIVALIRRIPLKVRKGSLTLARVLQAMKHDKKAVDGKKRFVLPNRVGEVQIVDTVEPSLIRSSLKYLFSLQSVKGKR
jgi:3-dehydroquinate synthase